MSKVFISLGIGCFVILVIGTIICCLGSSDDDEYWDD